jgi:hypothetical protein
MDQVKAAGKYFASFLRTEWGLEDYPLKTIFRGVPATAGRRKPWPWTVQVINWWHMRGDGDTEAIAVEQLRERLAAHRVKYGTLPRPGRGAKIEIEFAPSDEIQGLNDVAIEFFPAILGLEFGDCLVTDKSSLWDFHDEGTNTRYEQQIRSKYGVDVSDLKSGNLAEILRRIRAAGAGNTDE